MSAEKLAGGIDAFIDAIGRITAWSSFALALVMGGNVLLRYAFNTGTVWSQELEWHLMAPICLFGMSYALRHGEHVRVDVLYASFSQKTKDLVEVITALLAMAISADRHLAVDQLRDAVLEHRRRLGQPRRHSGALHPQGHDPGRLRAVLPAIAGAGHPRLSRVAEAGLMPFNELLALLMLVAFFVLLMAGIPVALTLATAGLVFGYIGFGPLLFNLLPNRIFGVVTNYTLIAMPLFVFMGVMLEKSRLAEDLMEVIGHAAGNLRGGLGIGIIIVGVLMGATTGIVGATVVTLGLLTLPTLLRYGYDKGLACGIICASGTLGQIIPPSLILILLADIMNESVGTLFAAAMIPGLMLAGIYIVYILGLGIVRPDMVPAVPQQERDLLSRARPCRQAVARRAAADRAGRRGARLDHRGHRGADRGRLDGRARRDRGHRHRTAHVVGGAARHDLHHDAHHRDDDVHPDLRAGVLARLPRTARANGWCRISSPTCPAAPRARSGS